ncbi:cytidylyltransferase domain-containing protein [Roseobacter ponti]|uniref:Acylneuraminate cytidylyltransferase family protein n=1 Tax=Roseobacter ponti TaxID=1891787 RepID=A0A858SVV1_9RHOB|nr:acylneuraminate cytidylyltransferase family protein [Roseobacter ponti]QJF52874.1 acylneuraminate cytidylyltransferase family protein [Roseobacter ponti]
MSNGAYTAFIFCRGGSKGIPDKNIRVVAGKPLLTRAVEGALVSDRIGRVIVSTDSERIAQTARDAGAEVLMRPDELATDTASEVLAWRHAIDAHRDSLNGVFISLPATSPLRATEDIDAAIDVFEDGGCDIVFGISPSHRSPFLNMVRRDNAGLISLVNPGAGAVRRQDVPPVFDVTTCVYVGDTQYIDTCEGLMSGRVGSVVIPPERALDIDTPFDLHLAGLLLSRPFGDPL